MKLCYQLIWHVFLKRARIAVEFILELFANGWTDETIMENYPQLKKDDIQSVLRYATDILKEEMVYPFP